MYEFCGKCRKGHVLKDGLWAHCDCLKLGELRRRLLDSGFGIGTKYYSWDAFLKIQCGSAIFDSARKELCGIVDPPKMDGKIVVFAGEHRHLFAWTGVVRLAEVGYPVLVTTLERMGDYYASQGTFRDEWRKYRSCPVLVVCFGRELENSLSIKLFTHLCQYREGQEGMVTFWLNNSSDAEAQSCPVQSKDSFKDFKSFCVVHVGYSRDTNAWDPADKKIRFAERKL